jgi:dihydrofolate reductase
LGRIRVVHNVTLDGVDQAPGRADEDTRGGFAHGGWAVPYSHDAMGRVMAGGTGTDGALLLGRRTFEDLAGFWPRQPANPFTEVLNRTPKHVASRTLREPLGWLNSFLLTSPVPDAVRRLKSQVPGGLVVLGSGELVRCLAAAGLVDEYVLLIHPLVLGVGRRLFEPGTTPAALRVVDTTTTSTGVVIVTLRPTGGPVGFESVKTQEVPREAVSAEH